MQQCGWFLVFFSFLVPILPWRTGPPVKPSRLEPSQRRPKAPKAPNLWTTLDTACTWHVEFFYFISASGQQKLKQGLPLSNGLLSSIVTCLPWTKGRKDGLVGPSSFLCPGLVCRALCHRGASGRHSSTSSQLRGFKGHDAALMSCSDTLQSAVLKRVDREMADMLGWWINVNRYALWLG
ncbi:hypothetical protein BD289DRAFT_101091 [Coniella lustricola]|uniref:Uncharacterized protein n=1 Tax=Coniella lustricola TaxID=2025994 RepID=A0A2T3AGW9_9PEZI|nr:hypothetical protein BD289DRAFT_101091 [Coniella lustricola]